ncbi:MAG: holB [Gammaproteobacteria bacterium]|jgi:DNA polymerase-3 subunit delta'|nr:holB [Gammaproteobacteria bacterium]
MKTNSSRFPWQEKQWNLLWEAKTKDRLPHALLFGGALGVGKMQFAEKFGAALLCDQPIMQDTACGACHACKLISAKSHPDFILVMPEQPGQAIKIDQIRSVVNLSQETTLQGGHRVIIIYPAHAMNQYAANALLKTLEEATPKTLFILISEQNLFLPLTIQSRCQKIIFQKPDHSLALDWLKKQAIESEIDWNLALAVAEGAPLRAISLVTQGVMPIRQAIYNGLSELSQGKVDPLQLAVRWQEYDIVIFFHFLLNGLRDLLRLQLTQQQAKLVNDDYRAIFTRLIQGISLQNILSYVKIVEERYAQILNLQNLNRQLLLEELLIDWTKYYVPC